MDRLESSQTLIILGPQLLHRWPPGSENSSLGTCFGGNKLRCWPSVGWQKLCLWLNWISQNGLGSGPGHRQLLQHIYRHYFCTQGFLVNDSGSLVNWLRRGSSVVPLAADLCRCQNFFNNIRNLRFSEHAELCWPGRRKWLTSLAYSISIFGLLFVVLPWDLFWFSNGWRTFN